MTANYRDRSLKQRQEVCPARTFSLCGSVRGAEQYHFGVRKDATSPVRLEAGSSYPALPILWLVKKKAIIAGCVSWDIAN